MVPDPAFAVQVPPLQLPVAPLGLATTTLAGSVSVNATPVRQRLFGFVMLKLRTDTPLGAIVAGVTALAIDCGRSTRRALAVLLPVPALSELTVTLLT